MAQNSRKLIAALAPWNAWEGPLSHTGIDRDITTQLLHLIGRPEALVLTGIRRSGKSTIMLQLIEALVSQGNDRKSILYVNFEEPTLDTRQGVELLEDIYLAFREILWPAGHATLFLDEIQYVNEWEKWVNARLRTEDVDIIVSGSSAQLMSREIATLLTGRNITVRIFPLSFSEFLRFRGVDGSIEDISISKDRHRFRHELSNYLQWGAFPEAALEKSEAIRSRLLSQYLLERYFDKQYNGFSGRYLRLAFICCWFWIIQAVLILRGGRKQRLSYARRAESGFSRISKRKSKPGDAFSLETRSISKLAMATRLLWLITASMPKLGSLSPLPLSINAKSSPLSWPRCS